MCTAIVSSRGIFPVDGSARGEDFYLATRGDFSLATRGDLEVATREDFFMATDIRSAAPTAPVPRAVLCTLRSAPAGLALLDRAPPRGGNPSVILGVVSS